MLMQRRFHRPVYFEIDFLPNFEYQVIFSKSVIINRRPEKSISNVLIAFTSPLCNYRIVDAHAQVTLLPFREKIQATDKSAPK